MATTKQFSSAQFDLSMIDFKCSQRELIKTKKIYELQCNNLCNTEKQEGLWRILTFQRINCIPLFSTVIDSFMRDRLHYYYKTKKTLSSTEWINKYNKTISKILHETKYPFSNPQAQLSNPFGLYPSKGSVITNETTDLLKGCVDLFGKRYSTYLCLNDISEKYDDSLESFASWIKDTDKFIYKQMSSNKIAAPYQVCRFFVV